MSEMQLTRNVDPSDTERMRRALEIACAALDEPESSRRRWADAQCGQDATLRQEVAALLAADESPDELLLGPEARTEQRDQWPGRLVGRYRIGERIGSGGMGSVYRAQPESGVGRRPVALKLIKRGMDSEEILRRFLREREILARLDHPNIARLLDGGMTADERPWFALELVEGQPLLAWCDGRELPLRPRIELLLQICAAVAYAHQNLVVHRDLKPGNVLVTAAGQVKLLDFGIAKLIDADGEAVTRSVIALMTPDYAAPEQLRRGPITTQTDVYLLGLLLFELLTGLRHEPALDGDDAQPRLAAAFSGRATAQDPERMALAARRGLSVPALARQLEGDLDRIVRRALAVKADARYAGVTALADDLQRYLRGDAVLARDGDWRYRLGRFVHSHRVAVGATVAVLLALSAGIFATWRESARLRVAEARLESSLVMLEDVFLGADPYQARGGDTRATDLLAGVRDRLQHGADLPPALAARLWYKLGTAYVSLDQRVASEAALHQAVALAQQARDCRSQDCADSDPQATRVLAAGAQARLAHFQLVLDDQADALPALEQAIATLRDSGERGRLLLAEALIFLNDYHYVHGQFEGLDERNAEAVALVREAAGEQAPATIMAIAARASLLRAIGHSDQALAAATEAYTAVQQLGEQAPAGVRLYCEQQYAGMLSDLGQAAQAEPVLRSAYEGAVALRGADSVMAHGIGWELANAHAELGQFETARDEFRRLLGSSADIKAFNVAALHNALGTALIANDEAGAGLAELTVAAEVFCAADQQIPPCVAVRLNQIDAALHLGLNSEAAAWLDELRATAMAMAGRAAMRWHWLASRLALVRGNPALASTELAASRKALPEGATSIDQARWFEQDAALAERQGDRLAALGWLNKAEAQYRQQWLSTAPPLQQLQARLAQLQIRPGSSGTGLRIRDSQLP